MKKYVRLTLCFVLCLALALLGCGKTDNPTIGDPDDGTQTEQPGDMEDPGDSEDPGDTEDPDDTEDPGDTKPTDREELTRGYAMRFSVPSLCNRADAADDFYLKAERDEDGFLVSLIGFGDFTDNEYVKLIFHTSETHGTGWNVQISDLNVLVNKTKAAYRTNITKFWSADGGYTKFAAGEQTLANAPVYKKEKDYFTLTLKVLFGEIPDYTPEGRVSLFAMEFADNGSANGLIYDAVNYMNGMLVDGVSQGDPAAQSSYYVIQLSAKEIENLEYVKGYGIEFSPNADRIYAKVEKGATSLTVKFRAFQPLDDTDFIRIVLHTGEPLGANAWALHRSDVSFTVYKNIAYTQTDKVGFFEGADSQFHGRDTAIHAPVYTQSDEYWDLTFVIEYMELGADTDGETEMRAFFGEYTSGSLNLGAKQDGVSLGDQAYQKNWFVL